MSDVRPCKGYYSLIQYCPDPGRLEAANIGVLLFCPDCNFLKALTSRSNGRIRKFFGSKGHDWSQIDAFKKGVVDRIEVERPNIQTLDDLEAFISLRANLLQITSPRPMKVVDPEGDLKSLFTELVGEAANSPRSGDFHKRLAEKFASAGVESKIRRDLRIHVPVMDKDEKFPFAFQNGRLNLIQPVRFQATTPSRAVDMACKYAVEGRELYVHRDAELGELQLVVVGHFVGNDEEAPIRVGRFLEHHHVKLFRTNELTRLIDEIQRTGKDISAEN